MFSLRIWILLLLLCISRFCTAANDLWILDVRGPIGAATMEYVVSSIELANSDKTPRQPIAIIMQLDTPGGLDNAMRSIIKSILSSEIPIVGYVHPKGARAASAGTYILYATHIAAMSPATNLGAATPVQIGLPQTPSDPDEATGQSKAGNAMERKIVNDATAYIEGLADLRGRNREWAATAVLSGASISANDALKKNIVNIIAEDIDDLLKKLNGYSVVINGQQSTLDMNELNIVTLSANWRQEFLSVVGNPSFAYILMLIGIYGIIFEFSNPGGGVFGIVGVVSLIIGSVILIDTPEPAFQIAWPIIFSVAILSAAFSFLTFSMLFKSRKQQKVSGIETLLGETAEIESIHQETTLARIHGELWQVQANVPLSLGDKVIVSSIRGLTLNVLKQSEY